MISDGLWEVFKCDSADTSAGKFPLVSMWGRANGQACAYGERGPPSARAEIFHHLVKTFICDKVITSIYLQYFGNYMVSGLVTWTQEASLSATDRPSDRIANHRYNIVTYTLLIISERIDIKCIQLHKVFSSRFLTFS
jgi:hypothetical protein